MSIRVPAPQLAPYTVDELHQMPDDGNRYELLFGEIDMSPAPSMKHQLVSAAVNDAIRAFVSPRGGTVVYAPVDVYLAPHSVVQPDLLVILAGGRARILPDGVHGPPDLIVEILSPATRGRDLVKKTILYATAGVPEYWVIDPDAQTVTIKQLAGDEYQDVAGEPGVARSLVVPGLEIEIVPLFAYPASLRSE